jgi:putative ABC transport system permease protein
MESLLQDISFGMRILRRNPAFAIVAGLTLALGIGVNTAVFSVVNAVIVPPLRFPNSARLMAILSTNPATKEPFWSAQGVYVNWRERSNSFETIAGARSTRMLWSGVRQPRFLSIAATSFDFLPLIGARPTLGRTFTKAEDQPGRADVALLDAGFWQREFGGKTDVIGRKITLDEKAYSIIGVLPEGRFGYFGAIDVWIPMAANRDFRSGGDVTCAELFSCCSEPSCLFS